MDALCFLQKSAVTEEPPRRIHWNTKENHTATLPFVTRAVAVLLFTVAKIRNA